MMTQVSAFSRAVAPLATLALLTLLPPAAGAQGQDSGSQSIFFDPSIEGAAMGGTGVATWWKEEPNSWANPALLGTQRGLRYSYGKTQILEEFSDDTFLKSNRFLLGGWGVGLLFAGKPVDELGEDMRLEYGKLEITDVDGNPLGVIEPWDETRSIAVGVSVLDLASGVMELLGKEPIDFRRYLTLSVGHTWKDFVIDLAPGFPGLPGRGEGEQKDRGAAIRIAPLNQIGFDLLAPSERHRFRVELGGGYSELNYDDDTRYVSFDDGNVDPVFETHRVGATGRFTVAFPSSRSGWIHDWISPTVSVGAAWESNDYYDVDGEDFGLEITRTGQEIVLADVIFLRHGFVKDDVFVVEDDTWGAGFALNYRKMAGARFDWAHYPYSPFIEETYVHRYGVTVFVDPFRIWGRR